MVMFGRGATARGRFTLFAHGHPGASTPCSEIGQWGNIPGIEVLEGGVARAITVLRRWC